MKVFFEPGDAKYIVFRMAEGMDRSQMPVDLEGRWDPIDRYVDRSVYLVDAYVTGGNAFPTNGFEVRSDGEIAQMWEVMSEHAIFQAFGRLARYAPGALMTYDDLAKECVHRTMAHTARGVLKGLGCEVKRRSAGGDWIVIPLRDEIRRRDGVRWSVVVDPKKTGAELEQAYAECVAAILFDHFGQFSLMLPPKDVQADRLRLYEEFGAALRRAVANR